MDYEEDGHRRWVWLAGGCGLFAVLCVVVSAATLAYLQGSSGTGLVRSNRLATPTPQLSRATAPPAPTVPAERLQPEGKPLVIRVGNSLQVNGLVRNPEGQRRSAIIVASFTDSTGKPSGSAIGSVQNVQPGDTKPYTLYSSEPIENYANFVVQVQSRLPVGMAGETAVSFSGTTVRSTSFGFQIETRATNGDSVAHRFVAVGTLLDAAGNVIGIARGTAPALAAGNTTTMTLDSYQKLPAFATVRVQVDILDE